MLKNRSSRTIILFSLLLAGSLAGTPGCSEPTLEQNPTAELKSQVAPAPNSAAIAGETQPNLNELPGIWLGNAVLDQAKLTQKISSLTPAQQELVLAKATSFLSTIMAVEYRSDGTLENDLEMVESFLKFFAEGNRFVTAVTLGQDLQGCDAMIVFEKQQLTGQNIADKNLETEKR